MAAEQKITKSIVLNASPSEVWDALTNPAQTKKYMFNCEPQTDWKTGSRVKWKGEFNGYVTAEQGVVLESIPGEHLAYTSYDPNFGLQDIPENYLRVIYHLQAKEGKTELTTTLVNLNGDENRTTHVAKLWEDMVLPGIAKLFEV